MDEFCDDAQAWKESNAENDSLVVMRGDEVIEISAEQLEKEVAEARAKDERENPTRS